MSEFVEPPDALERVLGEVAAEAHLEWRKDLERIGAEARAILAEFREKMAGIEARVAQVLSGVQSGAPGVDGAQGEPGPVGKPGEPGPPGPAGRDGVDGANATPEQIATAVEAYLKTNPPPSGRDGRDGGDGKDGADGKDGPPGRDGKDGEAGRDGTDGEPGQNGTDGKDGRNGLDGKDGADGKDGIGLADALIDRSGELVLTMTDGRIKSLGTIVGKDGAPGRDGTPGKDGAAGKDGRDGQDGVGFDDLDLIETEKGMVLRFVRGERVKEFTLPVVVDRGVYSEGTSYSKGSGVTWAGSFWIAQRETSSKPDAGDGSWRLAVKRGRDGKDGVMKTIAEPPIVKVPAARSAPDAP